MTQPKDNYRDWEFSRKVLRLILREWATQLSPLEYKAALFVYDRTIGWGKQWEAITQKQTSEGVYSPEGECWAAPISTNATRARDALHSLVEKGYIFRQKYGQKSWKYSLNIDMKIPKKDKFERRNRGRYRNFSGDGIVNFLGTVPSHKEIYKGREAKDKSCACPRQSQVDGNGKIEAEEIIRKVIVLSEEKMQRRKKSGKFERSANGTQSGFVPFRTGLLAVWKDFHKKYFDSMGAAAIDAVSLRILHLYAKNWTNLRESGEFLEFLEWVFQNWQMLRAGPFSWMADFPLAPSIRIITSSKLKQYIEEAHRKKEWWDKWRAMDEFERKVEHLVTMKGMDRQKAEEIAKKETGFKEEIKALKEERRKLELTALRTKQAYTQGTLNTQHNNNNRSRLTDAEGDFGKWDK